MPEGIRATHGNRTRDLLITNQLLYQLSYISEDWRYYLIAALASTLTRDKSKLRC